MIEATLNQGVIQLSEVTRSDEFLPAHSAEASMRRKIRADRVSIGLGIAVTGLSAVAAGMLLGAANLFYETPHSTADIVTADRLALMGGLYTGIAILSGITNVSLGNDLAKDKLKLAKVQHLLSTTPARR